MLTEKYGAPVQVVEKFDTYSEPTDDDSKIHQVIFDGCKYYSIWQTEKGEIQLSIDHIGVNNLFVKLGYLDKENGSKIRKTSMDDL